MMLVTNKIQSFEPKLELADLEKNLILKRGIYNEVFETLQLNIHEELLFKLLEDYATRCCYSAKEYRVAARLMEVSLCLQFKYMNLLIFDYNWKDFTSLEAFIESLEVGKEQDGKYFPVICELYLDNVSLHKAAIDHDLCLILKKSLLRLIYSYQKLCINHEYPLGLHSKLNEWIEPFLETSCDRVDFAYQRRPFMTALKYPNDPQAKIKTYKELIHEVDSPSKLATIYHKLGRIYQKLIKDPDQASYWFNLEKNMIL